MKFLEAQEIIHTSERRTVEEMAQLTSDELELAKEVTAAYQALVHGLVYADAQPGGDWGTILDQARQSLCCQACSGATLGAAIAIIAELAYKLDPEMTRENFAERYLPLMKTLKSHER